jgi:hypothetical protein
VKEQTLLKFVFHQFHEYHLRQTLAFHRGNKCPQGRAQRRHDISKAITKKVRR